MKEAIGPLQSLVSYGMKEVTEHPYSWLTIYNRRHRERLFMEGGERLTYFDLEVPDEIAHKVDIDVFGAPTDNVDLAYTLG